jgi:tripartite-type tricarboxylate transporter receptor subunit TctC
MTHPRSFPRKREPRDSVVGRRLWRWVPAFAGTSGALAFVLVACLCGPAHAQDQFPNKPITIVAPITPGTAIDIMARLYADKLSKHFGQQVVVANRSGAGGMIGAQAVANAPADGYTVLFANSGHAILGAINKNLTFDPIGDFSGVLLAGEAPGIVVVPPSLGVADLKEFVALAKAKPGTINYGSAGIGTSTHLAGAYFALKTGTDLVHIPYTVSATIIADLLGGRIQASFVPLAFVLPLLQDGRLKALAVGAKEPVTSPISIPTALSQGFDYEYGTWYGMLASAKTPKPILATLHQAMAEASKDPELLGKVRAQGIEPRAIGLDGFDAYVRADMARLDPVLKTVAEKR